MPSARARSPISVVDLSPEQEPLYLVCLEDWPGADLAGAGDHKARWYERARRAAAAHGEQVEVQLIDTGDRATLEAWGRSEALFVDGRQIRTGPPPSQERLARLIGRRVARL